MVWPLTLEENTSLLAVFPGQTRTEQSRAEQSRGGGSGANGYRH